MEEPPRHPCGLARCPPGLPEIRDWLAVAMEDKGGEGRRPVSSLVLTSDPTPLDEGGEFSIECQGASVAVLRLFRSQPDHPADPIHVRPLERGDFTPSPARSESEPCHLAEDLGP